MEVQGSPSDRISNLPPTIIQTILTLMPMRDAFRTSILSHFWRDHCLSLSKLRFDDAMFYGAYYDSSSDKWKFLHANNSLKIKCKLLHIVYPILLRHQGSILEFSLCISKLISCYEIDQIIFHLSRSATLKKFTLLIGSGDDHKILPAFFKLQQLTNLTLQNCVFQPPEAFNGFRSLARLSFNNVSMTVEVFLRFISNCVLLKDFTLIGYGKHFMGSWNSDFVEFFKCLPLVQHLHINQYPIQCFATDVIPQKLPTMLVHLKHLHLRELSFAREIDLLSVLLLVTSSPNIESIIMEMQHNSIEATQTVMNLVDQQDHSYVLLDHLREIGITNFVNMKSGMDFVKLILANSPMLKKLNIRKDLRVDINCEVKMLKDMIQYPRASASAEIIIK